MCVDTDLFGDIIVTLDDVEFWLDEVPKHLSNSPNARLIYARDYDVASKIKAAKPSGFYYKMLDDKQNLSNEPAHSVKSLFHRDYVLEYQKEKPVHRLAHIIG